MFDKLMGRLQDRMDAMSARAIFKALGIGMACLMLLGLVSALAR